jgi:peptidoglycan hydrolase-like protein with peptidoglycan-binding domain
MKLNGRNGVHAGTNSSHFAGGKVMATLRRGSTGPEVTALQQRLTDLGFDPKGIDGKFGPNTEAAVKAFQQAKGLTVDGIVGPITRAALQPGGTGQVREKVLWVVSYNSLSQFISRAVAANATAVAIRTSNNIPQAISAAHAANLKIYGWRWPSAKPGPAMAEADGAASFLNQGMDGYFVDPEGEQGQPYDWNQSGLEQLANDFCVRVKNAAGTKPLGVTSHYRAAAIFPKLPWAAFFRHADVLLPQAYWRVVGGVVGHGDPAENYNRSIQAWVQAGGVQAKIQPMAGELRSVTGSEITEYASAAQNAGIKGLHFYTDEPGISAGVWDAVKQS